MTQNIISPDQIVNNSQPNVPDTLTAYYVVVKSSDDPTKPRQIIGWPTVQYSEGSTPSYSAPDGFVSYLIENMTDTQWQSILIPNGIKGEKAYYNGAIQDYTPIMDSYTLKQSAQQALQSARTIVTNNYTMLNEQTPDAWVTYLKALMAIVNGTDTTSTELPTRPS